MEDFNEEGHELDVEAKVLKRREGDHSYGNASRCDSHENWMHRDFSFENEVLLPGEKL